MARMTESLARSILNGDGVTRWEVEQLARYWLTGHSKPGVWARFGKWLLSAVIVTGQAVAMLLVYGLIAGLWIGAWGLVLSVIFWKAVH